MWLKTDRWLGLALLSATVLLALACGQVIGQDVQPPGRTFSDADKALPQSVGPAGERTPGKIGISAAFDPAPAERPVADLKPPGDLPPSTGVSPSPHTIPAGTEPPRSDPPSTMEMVPLATPPAETNSTSAPAGEEPLKPIPDPLDAQPVEIEAASFKGVTPGVTTLEEVTNTWGAAKEISKQGNRLAHLYAVEPFDRVEVTFFDEKVASVVIRFHRAFPAGAVAEQLELTDVRPVLVSNDLGEILGQVYPERGVLFSFEPSDKPGTASMKVPQIILEPVTAEPFVLRAETNLDTHYQASRNDLEQALELQPGNARAHWLLSRVLMATDEFDKAVTSIGRSVQIEPGNAKYRVTRAQILGQVGQLAEAIRDAEKAVQTSQKRPHVKARALCLIGDLTASGATPDYKRAIQFHMEAIKVAMPLAADRHPALRLAAKEVLINSHLGAAHDIAWGNWKEKEKAVERWLSRASTFAEDLIESDGGNPEHRFRVSTRALAACVGVRGKMDPGIWTKAALKIGEELIATTDDPVRKAQYQWDLGMALYDALQIYQMRNEHDQALKHGEWAIEYLEKSNRQDRLGTTSYQLGRLYFRLGAIHAVRDNNHRVAITWFDRALPLLKKPIPKEAFSDLGRHGETFVSMGVSYWESGRRDRAVELTRIGIDLMQQAVKQGSLDESALAIPYSNLASMQRQLGHDEEADRFENMAEKIDAAKASRLK